MTILYFRPLTTRSLRFYQSNSDNFIFRGDNLTGKPFGRKTFGALSRQIHAGDTFNPSIRRAAIGSGAVVPPVFGDARNAGPGLAKLMPIKETPPPQH